MPWWTAGFSVPRTWIAADQVVELAQNVGLAEALNAGLQACSYELVARADSDDLSEPTQFCRLIPALVEGGLHGTGLRHA